MLKQLYFVLLTLIIISCNNPSQEKAKETLNTFLNEWHQSATDADLQTYIGSMATQSVYIGTDATENWTRTEFEKFCKPYFAKKNTWNFTPLERNVYLGTGAKTAWFDELLKTQMGICRGSGTLERKDNQWKIKHYVLSMTIPNAISKEVTSLKKGIDTTLLLQYDKAVTH